LPELELVPAYRPLFICQQCGFSNVHIPLCLWCKWTSPESADAFKAATSQRGRRISGPSRVTWTLDRPDLKSAGQRPTESPANPPGLGPLCGSKPSVATNPLKGSVSAAQPHPHSDEDLTVKGTPRAPSNLITDHPQKRTTLRVRRGLPAASVVLVPPRYPTTIIPPIPSPSSNMTTMSEPVKHTNTHPVSLPQIVSPSHTLRRKHHMTFPRQKSTRSLRSWTPVISPSPAPATSVVRLGHPSRPYYTAIRPHLNNGALSSRPNTPTTPVSAPLSSTDKGQSLPSPPPGRPSFEFTRPRSSTTSGWSLSGEIELQIELSQMREKDGAVDGSGKRGSIDRGVRRLGNGLRDLVLRRG
jgi:hypothetical protein